MKNKEQYFLSGSTTQFVCQYDHRFSYCAYVPKGFEDVHQQEYKVAVIVHGSLRNAQEYRQAFIDFAEENKVIIFTPLFPGGVTGPWESDSYKFVRVSGIKYDEILLEMIKEFSEKIGIQVEKFLLHGFSGGGQFVHRFFYLHPDKVLGLSIGAPGNVTLLDSSKPWYLGIGDYREQFGRPVPYESMKRVHVLMIIGKDDTEEWMVNDRRAPFWDEGFMDSGTNRIERLKSLKESFEHHNIPVEYQELAGIGHEGFKVLPVVKDFFLSLLAFQR